MPEPAHGEPLRAGQRRPMGKAARGELAVVIGCAEETRRIEMPRADLRDAFDDAAGIVLLAEQRHEGMIEIGNLSPVERRMGIEDLQAAHQHDEQAKRVDPVQRAHRAGVPVKELPFRHPFSPP